MAKTKWVYSRGNLLKRLWASYDGAVIMFSAYVLSIMIATVLELNYYELPLILKWIFAPATLITGIPSGNLLWLGLPIITIMISAVIWAAVGYIVDFIHDPYN